LDCDRRGELGFVGVAVAVVAVAADGGGGLQGELLEAVADLKGCRPRVDELEVWQLVFAVKVGMRVLRWVGILFVVAAAVEPS